MPRFLSAVDNYNNMRGGDPQLPMCPTCQVFFDPYGHGFPGRFKPKYDLSISSEHMHVASPQLKEFLDERCPSPIEYFETGGGYFILRPRNEVVLDLRRWVASPLPLCKACGEPVGVFSSVGEAGEAPVLPEQQPIGPMDMVRSRQRFAERRQRNFKLIIGDRLAEELKAQKFSGLVVSGD